MVDCMTVLSSDIFVFYSDVVNSLNYHSFKACNAAHQLLQQHQQVHRVNVTDEDADDEDVGETAGGAPVSAMKVGMRMARFNVDKVAVAYVETLSSAVKANPATTYEENQRSQRWRSWRDLALYVVAAAIVHLVFNRNKR
jgi:hypothetical protein